jgi:pimeloyl-ACP methyl ester carboxylesterase
MSHAAVLIPGFLGFSHRHGTTYFADRFLAGLRARLEAKAGAPFPVVPVTTLPLGNLAVRQELLLSELERLDAELGAPRWHIIGHSAGGVDAAMLARTRRLRHEGGRTAFSSEPLGVPRLASVTTLSAPHHGTCLTRSALASLLRRKPSWHGVRELLEAAAAAVRRDRLEERLRFVAAALLSGDSPHFYASLMTGDLVADLDPAVTAALTRADNRRPDVPVLSIATIAPPPGDGPVEDELYAALWRWTQEQAGDPTLPEPPPFPASGGAALVAAAPVPPTVDARSNDGVVNTARQVDGTFLGLVVGDHADVLGRYRRTDPLDGRVLDPGLLTSGARFGDDQFFSLLDLVASGIARAG